MRKVSYEKKLVAARRRGWWTSVPASIGLTTPLYMRHGAIPTPLYPSTVRSVAADEGQEAVQTKIFVAAVFGLVENFFVAPRAVKSHRHDLSV
jgi:hypothetical protein